MHYRNALDIVMLPLSLAKSLRSGASGNALTGIAKFIPALLPSLTQASLIGSALIVSYGYPLLFGLTAYGHFATATVLTFITQRIVDLIAESTIAERDPSNLVKSSLIVSACALLILAAGRYFFPTVLQAVFDLKLFLSLVISTVVLNLMFQIGSRVAQFFYAAAFALLHLVITLTWFALGRSDLPLALTITNILGFCIGASLLLSERKRAAPHAAPAQRTTYAVMLRQLPYRALFAAFQIVATFGAVIIATRHLPAEQIGALRLLTTFALMGYSLSPVNPKMLYSISRTVENPAGLIGAMRPFAPMFTALLLCWLIAITAIGWIGMARNDHLYLYALALYPVVMFSAVFEKVLLNRRGIRTIGPVVGLFAAATAGTLLLGQNLQYYAIALIICIAAYPLVLASFLSPQFLPMILLTILLAGIGALLIGGFLIVAAGVAVLMVGFAALLHRLSS